MTRAAAWAEWLERESDGPLPRYHRGFSYVDAEDGEASVLPSWDLCVPPPCWLATAILEFRRQEWRLREMASSIPGWSESVVRSRFTGATRWRREEVRRLCRLLALEIPPWAIDRPGDP